MSSAADALVQFAKQDAIEPERSTNGKPRITSQPREGIPTSDVDAMLTETVGGLTEVSTNCEIKEALEQFGTMATSLDVLNRQLARRAAIRKLKPLLGPGTAKLVDAAFKLHGANGANSESMAQGQAVTLTDPEPWTEPVDGAELLVELVQTFAQYVALPKGAATTLALWVLHTHALDAAYVSPLLTLTSPERRCGKTSVFKLLGRLVLRPLPAANISPAALFRGVETYRPTLLLDEADTAFRESEELRVIVNSGHDREGAVVL